MSAAAAAAVAADRCHRKQAAGVSSRYNFCLCLCAGPVVYCERTVPNCLEPWQGLQSDNPPLARSLEGKVRYTAGPKLLLCDVAAAEQAGHRLLPLPGLARQGAEATPDAGRCVRQLGAYRASLSTLYIVYKPSGSCAGNPLPQTVHLVLRPDQLGPGRLILVRQTLRSRQFALACATLLQAPSYPRSGFLTRCLHHAGR